VGLRRLVAAFTGDAEFRARLRTLPATPDGHHGYAGGLLEHTVAVATLCREAAQIHPRLRGDLLLAAALLHDAGRAEELGPGPLHRPTSEGALLGHVHLGVRLIEARGSALPGDLRAELVHAVASHHDARAARTAEAAVLYHANQLDAEVVRDRRLGEAQERDELTHAGGLAAGLRESVQDRDSGGVGERLEARGEPLGRLAREGWSPGRAARHRDFIDDLQYNRRTVPPRREAHGLLRLRVGLRLRLLLGAERQARALRG
jgi:putative nucleotidyltransferase with HDIG domain